MRENEAGVSNRAVNGEAAPQDGNASSPFASPSITLPKGGGAIRGIGEKFAANPVTGTGSMSIPIAVSPGRSGFGPQLSLSYDSGSGNGPFGFGWSLSLPAITRKTDQGLPQYRDGEDSDVFILSGAEDLVPLLVQNAQGEWEQERLPVRTVNGLTYRIRRYRPRIEGLFARIERWTNTLDATDVFWRSISKDNITTWYGRTSESRIADPSEPSHIFSWLICQSHDDKGNVIVYGYKREDSARIFEDTHGNALVKAHERNRMADSRSAQRYLKRIRYSHHVPYFPVLKDDAPWPDPPDAAEPDGSNSWLFEVVFDYGEHDADVPTPSETGQWPARSDPFSSYRAGFEVRTYRTCQRVLMFHHFPGEMDVGRDCLVRSTDFTYSAEVDPADSRNPVYTFLRSVTQTGYRRTNGGYASRDLPPVEFEYTEPIVQNTVEQVDPSSLDNLPAGLDGSSYRWTDLHGEGIPGILTEQAGAWFYKRNLSPIPDKMPEGRELVKAKFAPLETVALKPNAALTGGAEIMDLAGDGQPDVVLMDGPTPGLYEHDEAEGWQPFRPFTSRLNSDLRDPNIKFIDLDGDGHADVLITEDNAFVWHASLAEEGFGPARRVAQALDEEKGPRVVFADGTQSIYLADLSGDGLTDIVRIRNGEICYWPNLGYGRFGAKVTTDNAPWFDSPDQFDHKRIRLADIDGSGTTDIIYLHHDGIRLYFNQSGNSWSKPQQLQVFPHIDDVVSIVPIDLLGNGTACLVWSSPLACDARRHMRYVDLMGGTKPHLLVKTVNNLGAETRVHYAPSTKFYLLDKRDGKPWITRLPFPIHVVERVDTYDHISRNRFVTRYAYHHGYFDGEEREFRGFGMVEQWDTEELAVLTAAGEIDWDDDDRPPANHDPASHVPPTLTRTWFHTGVYLGRDHVTDFFAGLIDPRDRGEYYREPAWLDDDEAARQRLLSDTILPGDLTAGEAREAARSLKGMMLRREVYALDGTGRDDDYPYGHPYTVAEQNFAIRILQPRGNNHHAVFFTHPREALTFHYERKPADPRLQHALTLEVDEYGNVLKEAAIGYGRRRSLLTEQWDKDRQEKPLITYTENYVTNAIKALDAYRAPLPAETLTFELTGYSPGGAGDRFQAVDLVAPDLTDERRLVHVFDDELPYEQEPTAGRQRRLIERVRTLYRTDDLTALLAVGALEPLALPGEVYKLAFTPGLLTQVYRRDGQPLLANPAPLLRGQGGAEGGYVELDGDGHWWIPGGRIFLSPDPAHTAAQEAGYAHNHFFLPNRYRDPFHTNTAATESYVTFDRYDLLLLETRDALGNRVTIGERLANGAIDATRPGNDYRVLQPWRIMDPNRNRTQVAYDALGMVVGTAIMGKPEETRGDSLTGFLADLDEPVILDHLEDPLADPSRLIGRATTRLVYDLFAYRRSRAKPKPQPVVVCSLVRETHDADLAQGQQTKLQHSFTYSDGFGREIQRKIQAERGPVPQRDNGGAIIVGPDGRVVMTPHDVSPRWVGSGWTVFNNKGKPVRQYEPFFTDTHRFEFEVMIGVSPVLFYDPVERVVATLHPNHAYDKVVFDAWQQTTYDVNDTIAPRNDQTGDPRTDPDIAGYVAAYFRAQPGVWQTWRDQRLALPPGDPEREAAEKAVAHADTPTVNHYDVLGRPFLTVTRNRVSCAGHALNGTEDSFAARVELDIEGNQRAMRDERKLPFNHLPTGAIEQRIVMRYAYDMLGNRIHQFSMEAGGRWMLNDATGKAIRVWDSRGHSFTTAYDVLRRPVEQTVRGTTADSDPRTLNRDILVDKIEYGEGLANDEALNLRTRIYRHFDSAGVATNARLDANNNPVTAYDFKGNLLRSTRRLVSDYKSIPDWAQNPQLDAETFQAATRYDALNRPIQTTTPHSSLTRPGHPNKFNIIQPVFNEANLLERVDVWLERPAEPPGMLDPEADAPSPVGVAYIDYDAKGQRTLIDYKTRDATVIRTTYTYDRETFRLTHLYTRRGVNPVTAQGVAFTDDCENPNPPPATIAAPEQPPAGKGCGLQNLSYSYDPAGNITHIRDDAQQIIYFKNRRVEPSNDYTYDALYRLIQAGGREHLGQGGAPSVHSPTDTDRVGIINADAAGHFAPNDVNAMGTYTERYVYDAVGNFLQMQHRGSDPAHPGWTRRYTYTEASLIEGSKQSNRLSSSQVGNGAASAPEAYLYDVHGSMVRMPHLSGGLPGPNIHRDYKDQLQQTNLGGGGAAFYVYDASGQRMRKVWEKAPGHTEERIYLGGFEIFRKHNGPIGPNTAVLERETLHVMDDKQRIALVETRTLDTAGDDQAPRQLIRYQFGNHLGSAVLELDDQGQIISYEEYAPYGSSTYQAVRSQTETAKRYRYTGKERDEETGLYYHGARYYAPWLGRWVSCDPIGIDAGINHYIYVVDNPVRLFDLNGKDWRDSLSWSQKAALWVDDRIQESPVAKGIVNNLDKRGRALVQAPAAIAEKYEKEGLAGIGTSVVEGVVHLGKDTIDAAADVGYYGAKAYYEGDAEAKEKVASRSLDILLNVADLVTLADGAGAAKNATVGGAKVIAEGAKDLATVVKDVATGGGMVTAEGVVVSGTEVLAATADSGRLLAVATDTSKATALMTSQAKNVAGGGKSDFKVGPHGEMPKPRPAGTESHHGVMSAWMKKHFPKYIPDDAPAILMSTEAHNATRAVYNRWRAAVTERMGGVFDWGKVTEAEMLNLSEQMFDAAKVPEAARKEYWSQWNAYKKSIGK
jgi:RHS repeat-associated protein